MTLIAEKAIATLVSSNMFSDDIELVKAAISKNHSRQAAAVGHPDGNGVLLGHVVQQIQGSDLQRAASGTKVPRKTPVR